MSSNALTAVSRATIPSPAARADAGARPLPVPHEMASPSASAESALTGGAGRVGPASSVPNQGREVVELSGQSRQLAIRAARASASNDPRGGPISRDLDLGDDATRSSARGSSSGRVADSPTDGQNGVSFGAIRDSTGKAADGRREDEPAKNPFDVLPSAAALSERDPAVGARDAVQAATGAEADAPQLTLSRGADGKEYATNGTVAIDVSVVEDDPQATIVKMWRAQAAALASGDVSGVDQQILALTSERLSAALQELAKERFSAMQVGSADATPDVEATPDPSLIVAEGGRQPEADVQPR